MVIDLNNICCSWLGIDAEKEKGIYSEEGKRQDRKKKKESLEYYIASS